VLRKALAQHRVVNFLSRAGVFEAASLVLVRVHRRAPHVSCLLHRSDMNSSGCDITHNSFAACQRRVSIIVCRNINKQLES